MLRELKFRAFHNSLMYNIDTLGFNKTGLQPDMCFAHHISNRSKIREGGYLSFDNGTIFMQFTGLSDKNGLEIYEGDVVKFSERRKHRDLNGVITYKSVVVYDFDCFCVSSSQENNQGLYCVNDECEVIGNIHEHKHLL